MKGQDRGVPQGLPNISSSRMPELAVAHGLWSRLAEAEHRL